jgi:hypothetical protein
MHSNSGFWGGRLKAAGIHLAISLLIAAIAALLVFLVWYPYPYREISGGRELFMLVISVDVILGPLLTLAVFNLKKPLKELKRDIFIIALLQLAALVYGLWTVAVARPVHLVFEIDRFRVVHAIDVPDELLDKAPPPFDRLPLAGPALVSVRDFKDSKESFEATMVALQGVALGARPDFWQSYELAKPQVLASMRPLDELKSRFPAQSATIDQALKSAGKPPGANAAMGYVPMVGRNTFWTVLLDANTAEVIAFVPVDSF